MTKPQIWVAAFLAFFILLFMLGRLTKTDSEVTGEGANYQQEEVQQPQDFTAEQLINNLNCVMCHGSNLAGTKTGPALVNLSNFWSRDNLINYLRNPSAYSSDARFKEYKEKYTNVVMPPYNNIDVKELGKIADYLLKK